MMVSGLLCLLLFLIKKFNTNLYKLNSMRNKPHFYLPRFVLILLLIIFFIIFLTNKFFYILVIKKFPEERIIFQKKISPNHKFAFLYVHSVAQTPVWEFFEIDNEGKMFLSETHFYDHGAGLPYSAFGEEIFIREENRFKIKNMNRKIELPLFYRIYSDRGNVFVFENQKIDLSQRIGDALLIIDIKRINTINYFLENILAKEK